MKKWKVFYSIRRTGGDIDELEDYVTGHDIREALYFAYCLVNQIVKEEKVVTDVVIWGLEICPGTTDPAAVF